MKLSGVRIKNFKSIKDMKFIFPETGILVLVGENNSGKSNIIRALDYVCGESWYGKEKLEDIDFYLRDKNKNIEIDLFFSNKRSVKFSPNDGTKWGITYFSNWEQTIKMPFGSSIKEDFPCTYLGADRTLDKHLSFYDWTLIGRIRKAFHNKVTEELKGELDNKYDELIEIFEKVPGFTSFKNDFAKYYQELLPTTNTRMSVDFKPFTPANYFKTMQILGIAPEYSDKPLDLSELGEGARNFILISLLRSFAENFKLSGDEIYGLLALEEPELFLHPQARRHLWKTLRTIAETGMQVIISTHSDSFIDTEYFDEIGRVIRIDDDENEGKKCSELITCSKDKLVKQCESTGVPKGKATKENISEYYTTTSNIKLNEGFFSRLLLLVEGETEELALPELLKEFEINCDALGISIIPVNGKNQIPKYWRLYSQFKIPIIVIIDNDNYPDKISSNKNIATCFGLEVNDLIDEVSICKTVQSKSSPKTSIVILEKDFEHAFSEDLKKNNIMDYEKLRDEAKNLIKPIGNQQKGVISRYIIKKTMENHKEFNSEIGLTIATQIADNLE